MSRSSSLKKKVDNALKRFNATNRVVYKRVYTSTGGDALTGRNRTTQTTDYLLTPQPAVTSVRQEDLMALGSDAKIQLSDLMMTASANAIKLSDLRNKDLIIVMKSKTDEEEYKVLAYTAGVIEGENVVFTLLLRSTKREDYA